MKFLPRPPAIFQLLISCADWLNMQSNFGNIQGNSMSFRWQYKHNLIKVGISLFCPVFCEQSFVYVNLTPVTLKQEILLCYWALFQSNMSSVRNICIIYFFISKNDPFFSSRSTNIKLRWLAKDAPVLYKESWINWKVCMVS